MTTREEIEEFAAINNLLIHPDRDIDYFIKLLNDNGGRCPCDEYRVCPCDNAPIEAQKAIAEQRNKEACCTCHFLVTEEYIEAWELKTPTKKQTKTETKKEEKNKWEPQTQEIKEMIGLFKKARTLAEKNKAQDAAELLTEAADNSNCGMCQRLLSVERMHMDVLGSTCEMDGDECEIEKQQMKERGKRIEKFLLKVDELAVNGTIDGEQVDDAPKEPERKQDNYHACLSTMPSNMPNAGALPEFETKVRFALASKMCAKQGRGEETTFEEELEKYKTTHPEFFAREE
jgi:hypothetical protein